MLRKLSLFILVVSAIFSLNSCASMPASPAGPKELKLKWNVSYVRGLVLVKEALKSEPIEFEKAVIGKDMATLRGSYTDGRLIKIMIYATAKSESKVAVDLGSSQAAKEESKMILEKIAQYSRGAR